MPTDQREVNYVDLGANNLKYDSGYIHIYIINRHIQITNADTKIIDISMHIINAFPISASELSTLSH